jgi:hypothetical protein
LSLPLGRAYLFVGKLDASIAEYGNCAVSVLPELVATLILLVFDHFDVPCGL